MLDKEFKYYIDNQQKLVEKYNGKFIVIMGEEVVGVYTSEENAFIEASSKFELGTFLIQFCESGDGSYTQMFNSRVSFA